MPGTCPTNSNQFEFVGQVAGTIYWSLRLDFLMKIASSHEGAWSPRLKSRGLVARIVPLCVPTLNMQCTCQLLVSCFEEIPAKLIHQ